MSGRAKDGIDVSLPHHAEKMAASLDWLASTIGGRLLFQLMLTVGQTSDNRLSSRPR